MGKYWVYGAQIIQLQNITKHEKPRKLKIQLLKFINCKSVSVPHRDENTLEMNIHGSID